MNFILAAETDKGIVKATNQDSFGAKVFSTCIGSVVFAVMCDGMGGLSRGELASATVVSKLMQWASDRLPVLCEDGLKEDVLCTEWTALVSLCNDKIKEYGDSQGISLGTTLTALLLTEYRCYVLNVGDSRIYQVTDDVAVLTEDHSLVAREIAMGNLTEEAAKTDSRRGVLLQCIGASEQVYPDIFSGNTVNNAVYFLCTDGFIHEITKAEIYSGLNPSCMTDAVSMKANMRRLIEVNKARMERDNISVLAIRSY